MRHVRRRGKTASLLLVFGLAGVGLTAFTASSSSAATSSALKATAARAAGRSAAGAGHTVSFAEIPGNIANYIFPLTSGEYDTAADISLFQFLMYPPLYWYGTAGKDEAPGKVGVNTTLSIAYQPALSVVGGKTVATVRLKPWMWSDGKQVTARDVEFFFNLLRSEKTAWWIYIPKEFPDNVADFRVISPSEFSVTFNAVYGSLWVSTELAQLYAIPQHAWDKTSASGPIGNYDLTTSGAEAVYNFLNKQSLQISTYATNPLWQVVDGPWRLSAFTPLTTAFSVVRNPHYSGPETGNVQQVNALQYTSDAAEFNALLSGDVDFGYIPFTDFADVSRVEALGYKVVPWNAFGVTFIPLNFANQVSGPMIDQLYVREALQRIINEQGYEKAFLGGYGVPTYGPVPLFPKNQFASPTENSDPYPYNPSVAKSLLKAHGWTIDPNGTDTCQRMGTGSDDCGAGIKAGTRLTLNLLYPSGLLYVEYEMRSLQSAAAQIGISISLRQESLAQVFAQFASCSKASCWQSMAWGTGWVYSNNFDLPDGDSLFYTGAVSNGMSYSSATADRLINDVHTGSIASFYAYENYVSQQLPVLWIPNAPFELAAIRSNITGPLFDPDENIYPQDWTVGG